jgi:hypothetical protein
MDQSKASLIAAISFVGTTGVMVLLCANAHIDFFPCTKTVANYILADAAGKPKLMTQAGTCSLKDHLTEGVDGEKDELTGVGWAMLAAFCLSIAMADSALMYTILSRKSDKTA